MLFVQYALLNLSCLVSLHSVGYMHMPMLAFANHLTNFKSGIIFYATFYSPAVNIGLSDFAKTTDFKFGVIVMRYTAEGRFLITCHCHGGLGWY